MSRGVAVCSTRVAFLCATSLTALALLGLAARADDLAIPAAEAGVSVTISLKSQARDALRPMIREPDLPPDIGDAAPAIGAAVNQTGAEKSAPAPAPPGLPPVDVAPATTTSSEEAVSTDTPKTGPEGVAAPVPGAIGAAIAALAPVDAKKSPIASLRNWGATRDAIDRFYAARGDMT